MSHILKWTPEEHDLLEAVRDRLKDKFLRSAPYPEVIGDRKIMRFIRGHNHVLDKICEMVEKFLDWRFENNIDDIRKDITDNKLTPDKFPGAEKILEQVKIMVVYPPSNDSDNYLDMHPLTVEPFTPTGVITEVGEEEYVKFRIYCLEYVAMTLEQVSDEKEKRKYVDSPPTASNWGLIEKLHVIRDLNGFSMFSINLQSQALGRRIMLMSADNYPEILHKCFVCNVPWVFNTIFSAIKLILPANTIAKIDMLGGRYASTLEDNIGTSRLPDYFGGPIVEYNPSFFLDLSEGGPLSPLDMSVLMNSKGDDTLELSQDIKWGADKNATAESA